MNFGIVASIGGLGVLALVVVGTFELSSSKTADFTFPVTDGKGTMTYRCPIAETSEESENTARAAHALFEPALLESARSQGKAMAASMSPDRPSSDVVAELEVINAKADAHRKTIHREIQRQFGCVYRGST